MSQNEHARRRVTYALWEFLNDHREFASGYNKSAQARSHSKKLWSRAASILNSAGDGAVKSGPEWFKMADEYAAVKRGKLVLKGDKSKAKKRKHKKKEKSDDSIIDDDLVKHGGWWKVEKIEDVTGSISIEFGTNAYISALDNGLFTIGAPHDEGDGPSPEEIFTAFPAGETKFALKSGYGKYLGVSKEGVVMGRSDAVGPMEQWEPVWQDGKTAILSSISKFMSVDPEDDSVVAHSTAAGAHEFCNIRSNKCKEVNKSVLPQEEEGSLNEVEVNYVKKFQKFQDKRLRVNEGDVSELKKAKVEGNLHETLLDRRSKMKADRYCK